MDETMFDHVTLVLLRRPADAPTFSEGELDELQTGHLAFLDAMREAGHLLASGPFTDQEDERLRGTCLYRTGLDETRALVQADPMVIARRLTADAMTWWTKRGMLVFPPAR